MQTYEIEPEDFGLERCAIDDIKTGTPEENAAVIRGVFSGEITGHRKNAIVLNAAGALMVGDKASSFPEGIALAREIIDSGKAMAKLEALVAHSNAFKNAEA